MLFLIPAGALDELLDNHLEWHRWRGRLQT